jgi:hypothetical protein
MSYSTTIEDTEFMGAVKARYAVIDIDSYTSGGEDVSPNDVGLNRFQGVDCYVRDGSAYVAQYDEENEKLILRGDGDGTSETLPEASAGTGTVSVRFVGKGK